VLEAIAQVPTARTTRAQADRTFTHDAGDTGGRRFRFGVAAATSPRAAGSRRCARHSGTRLDTLEKIGDVEEVTLPDLPYDAIARTILFAEAASAFEDMIESCGAIAGLHAPEDHYTPYARDAVLARTTSRRCACAVS